MNACCASLLNAISLMGAARRWRCETYVHKSDEHFIIDRHPVIRRSLCIAVFRGMDISSAAPAILADLASGDGHTAMTSISRLGPL